VRTSFLIGFTYTFAGVAGLGVALFMAARVIDGRFVHPDFAAVLTLVCAVLFGLVAGVLFAEESDH